MCVYMCVYIYIYVCIYIYMCVYIVKDTYVEVIVIRCKCNVDISDKGVDNC